MQEICWQFGSPDFVCSPRGQEIKEILVPRLVLTNPRNRLLRNDTRDPNYGFAVGEFLWYWRGSNKLDEMTYYNKRMPNFSDDGVTLNSAYGYILKGMGRDDCTPGAVDDQWAIAIRTLKKDPDSRRAVLQIHSPYHQFLADEHGSKDVPCTLSLQFFIREGQLHCHANMRSNDVHWGLTYDLFSFTLFQECMLLELQEMYPELKLGRYFHTAGSLHIYQRHYDMTQKMHEEYARYWKRYDPLGLLLQKRGAMAPLGSLQELDDLQELEWALRCDTIEYGDESCLEGFSGAALWMAQQLYKHRGRRDEERRKEQRQG